MITLHCQLHCIYRQHRNIGVSVKMFPEGLTEQWKSILNMGSPFPMSWRLRLNEREKSSWTPASISSASWMWLQCALCFPLHAGLYSQTMNNQSFPPQLAFVQHFVTAQEKGLIVTVSTPKTTQTPAEERIHKLCYIYISYKAINQQFQGKQTWTEIDIRRVASSCVRGRWALVWKA